MRTLALSAPLLLWSSSALAINMLSVGYTGGSRASGSAFTSGELSGSWEHVTEADFNAMTLTDLVAYDVIVVQWNSSTELDVSWDTKMSTYVESGGGFWVEDPGSIDDLGSLASRSTEGCSPGVIVEDVEGLTDGIADSFVNCHIVFGEWDADILSPLLKDGENTTMLYGEYGSGRVILSGPDHDYHASKTGSEAQVNQYAFVLNIVNWLGSESDACVPLTWYADADGDGYGDASSAVSECYAPEGYVSDSSDCDDTDPDAWSPSMWYDDFDEDGYGDPDEFYAIEACARPDGYTDASVATDCDDFDADIYPGAEEVCDGEDNDCDGLVDPAGSPGSSMYFADADGDGYGDMDTIESRCAEGDGWVLDATDCDDTTASVYPGAAEYCDGVDNDCDGVTDPAESVDASSWYSDADEDGYGDIDSATAGCTAPEGLIADASDCNDADAAINPDATEVCDEVDNNCDGSIDGPESEDAPVWFIDEDGDGYGFEVIEEICEEVTVECDTASEDTGACLDEVCVERSSGVASCVEPEGYVSDNTDCDDGDAELYPGAPGFDDDCVALEDTGEPAEDTGVVADDTGDADADGDADTDADADADEGGDGGTDTGEDDKLGVEECGCATGSLSAGSPWMALVGLLALARRRND